MGKKEVELRVLFIPLYTFIICKPLTASKSIFVICSKHFLLHSEVLIIQIKWCSTYIVLEEVLRECKVVAGNGICEEEKRESRWV